MPNLETRFGAVYGFEPGGPHSRSRGHVQGGAGPSRASACHAASHAAPPRVAGLPILCCAGAPARKHSKHRTLCSEARTTARSEHNKTTTNEQACDARVTDVMERVNAARTVILAVKFERVLEARGPAGRPDRAGRDHSATLGLIERVQPVCGGKNTDRQVSSMHRKGRQSGRRAWLSVAGADRGPRGRAFTLVSMCTEHARDVCVCVCARTMAGACRPACSVLYAFLNIHVQFQDGGVPMCVRVCVCLRF